MIHARSAGKKGARDKRDLPLPRPINMGECVNVASERLCNCHLLTIYYSFGQGFCLSLSGAAYEPGPDWGVAASEAWSETRFETSSR